MTQWHCEPGSVLPLCVCGLWWSVHSTPTVRATLYQSWHLLFMMPKRGVVRRCVSLKCVWRVPERSEAFLVKVLDSSVDLHQV